LPLASEEIVRQTERERDDFQDDNILFFFSANREQIQPIQPKRINSSREVALGNAAAEKTITKASCLAGGNSRASPALENEAF
jgi:hypothetical protein